MLFDFGLVILIWMVQLVVYPSFAAFQTENLIEWHSLYMVRITYIVLPLMLGQAFFATIQGYRNRTVYTMGSLLLVVLLWMLTFTIFVPLHNEIASGDFSSETLNELVSKNWIRTTLWSFLFVWTLLHTPKSEV